MSELIDNRAHRVRLLKGLIKKLHEGAEPGEVKTELASLLKECDPSEIALMEQQLMAEGMPATEIMGMCDVHADVVRDLLCKQEPSSLPAGHPLDTFHRENDAVGAQVASLEQALDRLAGAAVEETPRTLLECRTLFNGLMDLDVHYQRKEHLLFPFLEKHGFVGPSKVMWGKDDEVRERLRALGEALHRDPLDRDGGAAQEWSVVVETIAKPALSAVGEMILKENRILFPIATRALTETEWGEIWSQSPAIGWCLVDPGDDYRPPAAALPDHPPEVVEQAQRQGVALDVAPHLPGVIVFPTGSLNLDQLVAIFSTLPVDLTFVDADDRVRFFSEGPDRVFLRTKAVIGRKVQHCHPPGSVDVVERILEDFREGRQEVAEFWIDFQERFVQIRYYPLRDRDGAYLGTLEVTQDITHARALEGERRLLQYE